MKFKVGDKVRFNDSPRAKEIRRWRRKNYYPPILVGVELTVDDVYGGSGTILISGPGVGKFPPGAEAWNAEAFELATAARKPTVADDLRLRPSDRTILKHLKNGKSITPMKSMVVYGLSRLAAHIHRIKQAGYVVETQLLQDEGGHRYAEYSLAK